MSTSPNRALSLSRRFTAFLVIISTVSVGAVVGLAYAPGSPGFPYISPTYQAQHTQFQYQGFSLNAALYDVWYVPGSKTLILAITAAFTQTHFFGVGSVGFGSLAGFGFTNSPQGNFSTSVYVNNEKTFLVFPGNLCPDTSKIPQSGLSINVDLLADSPPALLAFQYTCQQRISTAMLTLGNPHIIVPSLILPPSPPVNTGHELLNLETYAFPSNSSTSVILNLRNAGTISTTLASYYVKDSSGNQWAQTNWNGPSINPNAVGTTTITIGSSCNGCVYTGGSGAFTHFNSTYTYTISVVTTRNNLFTYAV